MTDGERVLATADVLASEQLILSDTTPFREDRQWYEDVVYPARKFSSIQGIDEIREEIQQHRTWFREPAVRTAPRVVLELERFANIFVDKLRTLNRLERKRSQSKYGTKEIEESYERMGFERLGLEICLLTRDARHAVFHAERPREFERLTKLVTDIALEQRLKSNQHDSYVQQHPYHRATDLHADEQLAASALYLSLVAHRSVAIVTPDYDVPRLLRETTQQLLDERQAHAGDVRDALNLQPVTTYIVKGAQLNVAWCSKNGAICARSQSDLRRPTPAQLFSVHKLLDDIYR